MASQLHFGEPKNCLSVHFVFEGEPKLFNSIPDSFKGKKFESIFLAEKKAFVISLGQKDTVQLDYYRRAAARATKIASSYKIAEVYFSSTGLSAEQCSAIVEGALLANYSFDKYKQEQEKIFRVSRFTFPLYAKKFSYSLTDVEFVCRNVFMVRDLVSDNSNVVTSELLEKLSKDIARKNKFKITVLHEKDLKRLGMNMILSVGSASLVPPRIIILEYSGNSASKERALLVGKGITFDTGGLDIKFGAARMKDMRMDMAGAATVLGIMKSAAEIGMKRNLIGILACSENLVDRKSYRAGDIIKSYSGLTVENLNTDAEGRLVLGDAISYGVKKYNPKFVLEFSTLTGSIVAALGSHCAGLFSTDKALGDKMYEAGLSTYERVWPMPLFEEYLDETKGERSDLRSLGKSNYNGAIFAAAFLTKFAGGKPIVHLDVAGTATLDEAKDYMPKDGSGFGVRLAIEFLRKV
ncbi:MAG TPA: leucyl aminopeptidase family protein [archaeon]|nr:leucyl aminopeptidase family protein [archaeon]